MSSPIKSNFNTEWFSLSLIFISLYAGYRFFHYFPARVPSHWDIQGQINGYSSPFFAAFLVPLMMVGIYLLFSALPYLDPKKDQYASFAPVYHHFKDLIVAFMFAVYILVSMSGLGYKVDVGFFLPIMVGFLFVIIGFLLSRVKMNWFIGIRTPWTMSSETVWNKTHALSGRVFILSGLLLAGTVLVNPTGKIVLFVLSIATIILALPIYSYVLYAREKKAQK